MQKSTYPHIFWLSLTWLYVWRWCLFGWAFLLGFPTVVCNLAPSLIEGAFDVTVLQMLFLSMAVFFLCFSLRLLGTVVVAYGPARMNLETPGWVAWIRQPKSGWVGYIPWTLLGTPMILR